MEDYEHKAYTEMKLRAENAERERDAANKQCEALLLRIRCEKPCACMYDKAGDVCLVHSPAVDQLKDELSTLRSKLAFAADGEVVCRKHTIKLFVEDGTHVWITPHPISTGEQRCYSTAEARDAALAKEKI